MIVNHIATKAFFIANFLMVFTSFAMDISSIREYIARLERKKIIAIAHNIAITPYEERDYEAMMKMMATEPTYLLNQNKKNPCAHGTRYVKSDGKTLKDILTWTHILKTKVLTCDNEPVGFIQYTFLISGNNNIYGRIEKLVLNKKYRLYGFGKELWESAITDLKQHGANNVYAAVNNPSAREFLKEQDIEITIIPKSDQ